MRIHPVVNVSWVVWYKKQVKGQKTKEVKLVEVKILSKRKIRGIVKYIVW